MLLLLPEVICSLSLQFPAGAVAGGYTLETATTIATSRMRAATTLVKLALCWRFKYRRIGASASVVVVVTVVVVLAMVFVVVVVVVAAAVVVDVLLFGCESRSGADRLREWLHAFCVGRTVALRCGRCCCWFLRGIVAAPA